LSSACFQHPRLEGKRWYPLTLEPYDLVRLKAEYFERTIGDRFGCGRG
jgi:hypothetical protein